LLAHETVGTSLPLMIWTGVSVGQCTEDTHDQTIMPPQTPMAALPPESLIQEEGGRHGGWTRRWIPG
jgi:hypothetical protein